VMDVTPEGIRVTELADGVTREKFARRTGVPVQFAAK
jgi:acyl CoA:acetate/3-ketoacid CoA transferase beta subunit